MSGLRITWVGHATALIDVDGYRVITDPVLTRRVAHLRRRTPLPPADTSHVDVALVSHAHMDHCHLPSLRRLRPGATAITTRGADPLLRGVGFSTITEVDKGETVETGPITVTATDAEHRAGRGPHSRVQAPPIGFVVEAHGTRIYFPGDTDLFDGMAELAPIDVALLPIWGWGPSIGTGHLDPVRAAQATALLEPAVVVPIHWGTYAPEDGRRRLPAWFHEPPAAFRRELERVGEHDRLHCLAPGETLVVGA